MTDFKFDTIEDAIKEEFLKIEKQSPFNFAEFKAEEKALKYFKEVNGILISVDDTSNGSMSRR